MVKWDKNYNESTRVKYTEVQKEVLIVKLVC